MTHAQMMEVEATDDFVKAYADLWPLAQRVSQAIYQLTRPTMNPAFAALQLPEGAQVLPLLTAYALYPEPISGRALRRRTPYATEASRAQALPRLAEIDLLEAGSDGEYLITSDGRKIVAHFLGVFYDALRSLQPAVIDRVGSSALDETAQQLNTIVDAALVGPIAQWGTRTSHRLIPPDDVALARLDQALDDLTAFRDDTHLAAWQPHHIDGHAWEFFTLLWRGEVKTAAEMVEKAPQRGHPQADYETALAELIDRGWVQAVEDGHQLTPAGREIREQAEALTDRYFFAPWATLNTAQLAGLRAQLTMLAAQLEDMAKAPTPN